VALYVHGLSFGEFYWRFRKVPGYDFAHEQARAGHASIVIDRLGYDASGHPVGTETCVGSQADTVHQVITALREGTYRIRAHNGPAFARVALAGHSLGSLIAQVEAYSFGEIDALVITAYADQGQSSLTVQESTTTGRVCATGGEPAEDGNAGGYAYFGQTPDDFRAAMFHSASPAVIEAATALRNRDPCGMVQSVPQGLLVDQAELGGVSVPVLIVCGAEDALFEPDGCSRQEDRYSGSADVSTVMISGAGHALTLERTRQEFQAAVSTWLTAHGF
jgi:pimeloyl-ACP methyl ester carboxylesterase